MSAIPSGRRAWRWWWCVPVVTGLLGPAFPAGADDAVLRFQASAADALSLQDVLTRARERAPLVQAARERHLAAVAARAVVPAAPNPFIEIRGENFGRHPSALLTHDVFATISQPIELMGKRTARANSADAGVAVAEAEMHVSEWSLAFDVAALYVEALRARELLATLGAQQEGLAGIVDVLSQRVREGLSAEADLRKFETEHQRLRRQVTRTDIALRTALLRLSAIAGVDLRQEQLLPLAPLPSGAPGAIDASRVEARPDVAAARSRVARAEAVLAAERLRGVPDVTVTTGYKRTAGFDTGVAAITMPINLFDRNRVASALAAGEVAAARLELTRTRQIAQAEAESFAAAASHLAVQAASARQDLLEPAAVVRTAARASYVEGSGDVLQLVDAERVFAETAQDVIDLQLDAWLAYINTRLSLGETPLP